MAKPRTITQQQFDDAMALYENDMAEQAAYDAAAKHLGFDDMSEMFEALEKGTAA